MLFFDDNGDEDIDIYIYIYIVGRIDRMMRLYEYVCMCLRNNGDNRNPTTHTARNSLKDIRKETKTLGEKERKKERENKQSGIIRIGSGYGKNEKTHWGVFFVLRK